MYCHDAVSLENRIATLGESQFNGYLTSNMIASAIMPQRKCVLIRTVPDYDHAVFKKKHGAYAIEGNT